MPDAPQQQYATGEPGKFQGQDRLGIVEELWVLLSPLPHGVRYSGKISFIVPQGINGHRKPVLGAPQQSHATEEPGKVLGRDHVGNVERSHGYRARGVSIRGKFVLSRNPTRGIDMWLNVVLTSG